MPSSVLHKNTVLNLEVPETEERLMHTLVTVTLNTMIVLQQKF